MESEEDGEMIGDPWLGLCCGVFEVMFIFLLDMPNPGPIAGQCWRILANLFMMLPSLDRRREDKECVVCRLERGVLELGDLPCFLSL